MRPFTWTLPGTLMMAFATGTLAAMPFIELDPDSTTAFRERNTHRPFVSIGVNYFDPHTGWAPKIWQQFDDDRVGRHLDLLSDAGFNTIRVFITLVSFEQEAGKVSGDGEAKFRRLLDMCRARGIYVQPTGPEHWEGRPDWYDGDRYADEKLLAAEASWWRDFAGRFADEPAIFSYDLANEPAVGWDSPAMRERWNAWLADKYETREAVAAAWNMPAEQVEPIGKVSPPPNEPDRGNRKLLDYQRFREHLADEWTRRMTGAIRSVDNNHMVTVGHVQWSSPILLPSVRHYTGFDLKHNARHVDFVTVHFYPLDSPRPCDAPEGVDANRLYLEALLHEACGAGKPVMLGEFNWYGGGGLRGRHGWQLPEMPVEHQVEWCQPLLEVTAGRVCGWLNWGFADTPTARDVSRWSGLWTEDLELKPWGRVFSEFARKHARDPLPPRRFDPRFDTVKLDRQAALTAPAAANAYRQRLGHALYGNEASQK